MTRRFAVPLLALLSVAFFAASGVLRGPWARVSGDEATFVAMAESLALDGDLRFGTEDRDRLGEESRSSRSSVILQQTKGGVSYSKPPLYALLVAPFFRLFGEAGLILVNGLCVGAALWLLWLYLRKQGSQRSAALTWVSFAGTGLLMPYVMWSTSDAVQAALTLAGLALCLMGVSRTESASETLDPEWLKAGPLVGGALLGLLITMRLPNAVIAVIPLAALWVCGRRRDATRTAVGMLAALALATGLTVLLTGAPSPYNAIRATFNNETGYPLGEEASAAVPRFDFDRATYDRKKRLIEAPLATAYSSAYFLIGRYTGILLYFPLALFLVGSALRRGDRVSWLVLGGIGGLSAFYLVFLPHNYFGGAACIGNRYFLVSYAALPFALRRPLSSRALVAVWGVALVTAISALVSISTTRDRDASLLNHAHAGIFRRMPYESTAAGLAGGQDVFWRKELARFPDPYARVAQWKFRLSSEDPATEIAVTNRRSPERLRFLVLSSAPELEFVYRDWGRHVRVPLKNPLGKEGLVEIEPSRSLRYHPFWFRNVWDHGLPYYTRVFRLAVRALGGAPVEAEVRYLGLEEWPSRSFSREVLAVRLPEEARAGSSDSISIRLRNTSGAWWRGEGVFPVYLSYRLTPLDGSGLSIEGPRTSVGQIAPGAGATIDLALEWPERPGRYQLTVDLLIEGVSWFEQSVGEPLSRSEVMVEPR